MYYIHNTVIYSHYTLEKDNFMTEKKLVMIEGKTDEGNVEH